MYEHQLIHFTYKRLEFAIHAPNNDYIGEQIASNESFYEQDLLEAIEMMDLAPGVFVDAGAHIGNHTLFFAGILNRKVVAFEPARQNHYFLEKNIRHNRMSDVVLLRTCGLSSEFKWADVDFNPFNTGQSKTVELGSAYGDARALFGPLDKLVEEQNVALIKIDTEGQESNIIRGATQTISQYRPVICAECHSACDLHQVFRELAPFNYTCAGIFGKSNTYIFLNREKHKNIHDLAYSVASRRFERASGTNGYIKRNALPIVQRELDRQRRIISTYSASNYDYEKRVRFLEQKLAARDKYIEYIDSAYSNMYYDKLRKSQRKGVQVPRAVRKVKADLERENVNTTIHKNVRIRRFDYLMEDCSFDKPVRVGIAALPSRSLSLRATVESLSDQADEIFVCWNGAETAPDVAFPQNVTVVCDPAGSDQNKFSFLTPEFEGYYVCADDDIKYPPYFVKSLIYTIKKYNREVVAGWHGSTLVGGATDYYDGNQRRVRTFQSLQATEKFVQFLGTGCLGFDAAIVKPDFKRFKYGRMADIFFAEYGQEHGIPFVLVPHDRNEAVDISHMNEDRSSISYDSLNLLNSSNNVRARVNEHVARRTWNINLPRSLRGENKRKHVLFIGRVSPERWRKGGILHSCQMMVRQLEWLGYDVTCMGVETEISEIKREFEKSYSFGLVYTGDWDAQDSYITRAVCEREPSGAFPIYINPSFDNSRQSMEICIELGKIMNERDGFFVFSHAASDVLSRLTDKRCVALPKTIDVRDRGLLNYDLPKFGATSGVFCGDISKFLRADITPDPETLFEELSKVFSPKDITFVRQYRASSIPEFMSGVNLVEFSDDIHKVIRKHRIYAHLNPYCTFEMLPLEASALGVPVVYPPMPQSLDAYIGANGVRYTCARDLSSACCKLNRDKQLWDFYSKRGREQAAYWDWREATQWLKMTLETL